MASTKQFWSKKIHEELTNNQFEGKNSHPSFIYLL